MKLKRVNIWHFKYLNYEYLVKIVEYHVKIVDM